LFDEGISPIGDMITITDWRCSDPIVELRQRNHKGADRGMDLGARVALIKLG
jgi:hypothetical protein